VGIDAMDEATRICARLLREGTVPRAELTGLDHVEIRRAVEERLGTVGVVLATGAYSEHVGLRLSPDVTADPAFDAASNLGLHADACALLVVLWSRLVLQKRTAVETREVPGQASLLTDERTRAARSFAPQVRLETLVREFGPVLGRKTNVKRLVTQLRKLGFVAGQGETIEAGPLLELAIDGERLIAFIRRGVLAQLLEEREGTAPAGEGVEAAVLRALGELGGEAVMADLARLTGERVARLRQVVKDLESAGRVRRTGARSQTRYHLVPA
jgi:hypothetical protein